MTLDEFWDEVHRVHRRWPDLRLGQIAFNELYRIKPELADKVRATDLDPFYDVGCVPVSFVWWLEDNWEGEQDD